MLEYAGSQRRGLERHRGEGVALLGILKSLDWILVAAVGALVAVGLWAVSGVTRFDLPHDPNYYLKRQIIYVSVGVVVLFAALLVDPDVYRRYWRPIYIGTVSIILIVLALGTAARGSTRWINLGFITFQPSEFGKLLFTLAIAGFLAERARGDASTTIRALGLGAVPVVLVMAQPDLGTALVYMAALAAMLFICGTPWRQLAILGTLAMLAIVTVLWAAPAAGVTEHREGDIANDGPRRPPESQRDSRNIFAP
jgi:rod shape determining protein RodA